MDIEKIQIYVNSDKWTLETTIHYTDSNVVVWSGEEISGGRPKKLGSNLQTSSTIYYLAILHVLSELKCENLTIELPCPLIRDILETHALEWKNLKDRPNGKLIEDILKLKKERRIKFVHDYTIGSQ